jgi:hypothetical protein
MALNLDDHDKRLVEAAVAAIHNAVAAAHRPVGVAKRIVVAAIRVRNRGRAAAIRRYPFRGVCEASGEPLDERDAVLDELEPELGYAGRLRWVCAKANNSGLRSCGAC